MSRLKKALEKAKEARGEFLKGADRAEKPGEPAAPAPGTSPAAPRAAQVAPKYTETRVVGIDLEKLRSRSVICMCTEDEGDRVKILRTQILNLLKEPGQNTLLVTSARPGEGKTVTSINLAISLSHQMDRTVLLVDADLRKPSIHDYLGLGKTRGLTDYLTSDADLSELLINPGIEKWVILPAGKPLTNSAEMLGSPRMESLVKELKHRYPDRFIIFDCSSVLTSADPLVFSRYVDGVLLVVEAEKTRKDDLARVLEMMKDRPIVGTVYNKYRG